MLFKVMILRSDSQSAWKQIIFGHFSVPRENSGTNRLLLALGKGFVQKNSLEFMEPHLKLGFWDLVKDFLEQRQNVKCTCDLLWLGSNF